MASPSIINFSRSVSSSTNGGHNHLNPPTTPLSSSSPKSFNTKNQQQPNPPLTKSNLLHPSDQLLLNGVPLDLLNAVPNINQIEALWELSKLPRAQNEGVKVAIIKQVKRIERRLKRRASPSYRGVNGLIGGLGYGISGIESCDSTIESIDFDRDGPLSPMQPQRHVNMQEMRSPLFTSSKSSNHGSRSQEPTTPRSIGERQQRKVQRHSDDEEEEEEEEAEGGEEDSFVGTPRNNNGNNGNYHDSLNSNYPLPQSNPDYDNDSVSSMESGAPPPQSPMHAFMPTLDEGFPYSTDNPNHLNS
jgi:hypothetical protein